MRSMIAWAGAAISVCDTADLLRVVLALDPDLVLALGQLDGAVLLVAKDRAPLRHADETRPFVLEDPDRLVRDRVGVARHLPIGEHDPPLVALARLRRLRDGLHRQDQDVTLSEHSNLQKNGYPSRF